MDNDWNSITQSIHSGQRPDYWSPNSIVAPIVLSTTFKQDTIHESPEFYSYIGNNTPNRKVIEECLASLENAKFALCFPSGLSATTVIGLGLLESGDHVLLTKDVYFGIRIIFDECFRKMGISTTFIDMENIDEIEINIKPNTKVSVFLIYDKKG
jgi:cystathionine beta-lyase/cystathionine gamma-synthase